MTLESIGIDISEENKKALEEFEDAKKKVDNGELKIAMLINAGIGTDNIKMVLKSECTIDINIGFYQRLNHDTTKILEVYPNKFDEVEKYEGPSHFIPGAWEYVFRPLKKGQQTIAMDL